MTRKPAKDDMDLWRQVAKTTNPLHPGRQQKPSFPSKPGKTKEPQGSIARFEIGARAGSVREHVALPEDVGTQLERAPLQMDRKAFSRMKRGKLIPDARIDLHGKTLDQAHVHLTRFVLSRHSQGDRLLLVITGKGDRHDPHDPVPVRRGVLKRQVPMWLRQAPLSGVVLQITEAHRSHGGAGAYYVYLRRSR